MLRRSIPILLGLLATACAGEAQQATTHRPEAGRAPVAATAPPGVDATAAPGPVAPASTDDLESIPAAACEPGAYQQFVNAFAQFPAQRARFVSDRGRAQLGEFDVALVDYSWRRESDGVALELEMQRRGMQLEVSATPVERDEEDQPVRVLGPARRYAFEHRDGCWRYAGIP